MEPRRALTRSARRSGVARAAGAQGQRPILVTHGGRVFRVASEKLAWAKSVENQYAMQVFGERHDVDLQDQQQQPRAYKCLLGGILHSVAADEPTAAD